MNILHISTFDSDSGAPRAVSTLHEVLMKAGVDSNVTVSTKKSKQKHIFPVLAHKKNVLCGYEDAILQKANSDTLNFSLCFFSSTKFDMELLKKADIIHLHWVNEHFINFSQLKKIMSLGKPIVWTLHDMWPITGGCHHANECTKYKSHCNNCEFFSKNFKFDFSFFIFEIKRRLYKKYTPTFVGVSKWISDCAKSSGLLTHNNVFTIPLAIDVDFYKKDMHRKLRSTLGINEKQFVITFGAKFATKDKRKGFSYLVKALQILQKADKDLANRVYILIFGDNRKTSTFSIAGFKAKNLGYLDAKNMVDTYSASDVVVLPSLAESFSYVTLESLSCSTPVVAFHVCSLPELISHKKTGYLAKYKDANDLAAGISWIARHNPDNILGKNGRAIVEEKYTYEILGNSYMELYRSLNK